MKRTKYTIANWKMNGQKDSYKLVKSISNHYKKMKIQPAHFINENSLPFAEGNAIKYICRHKAKGKKKDIEKAIHYLEMIIERDYSA